MNWLDLLIIIALGIGLIKGLFDGFINQVISLISLILAIIFAGKIARPFRDMLISHESVSGFVSPHIVTVICYILVFAVILLAFRWLGALLNKIVKVTPISCLNFMLGGLLGAFFALFFLSLTFNIITSFDSDSKIIKESAKNESVFFYKVQKLVIYIAPLIKESHKLKEEVPILQENKDNQNNKSESIEIIV